MEERGVFSTGTGGGEMRRNGSRERKREELQRRREMGIHKEEKDGSEEED